MFALLKEKVGYKGLVLLLAGVLTVGGLVFWVQEEPEAASPFPAVEMARSTEESSSEVAENVSTASEVSTSIWVDVKGEVAKPGLYELPTDARIQQAVQAAGGFTEKAEQKSVNLAQKLKDEAVVYVAQQGEEISVVTPQSATGQVVASDTASQQVNLNTATVADLTTISGIGEKRANDIIAYRDSNGGFKTVDDLNNVSGIGDKTMENLRPYVTVE